MRSAMVLFVAGILSVLAWPELPALSVDVLRMVIALLAVVTLVMWFRAPNGWLRTSGCLMLAALLGQLWALQWVLHVQSQHLPAAWLEQDLWIQGRVLAPLQQRERDQQFHLQITGVCGQLLPEECRDWALHRQVGMRAGGILRLSDYSGLPLQVGEHWQLRVRLRPLRGLANPGMAERGLQHWQQRRVAGGYVRETSRNLRVAEAPPPTLRQRLIQAVLGLSGVSVDGQSFIAPPDSVRQADPIYLTHGAVIAALVAGHRDAVGQHWWDLVNATGTTHLLVISGLHVSFVALLGFLLGNHLARLSPALLERVPAQRIGAGLAIAAALFYSALAGFSLPTQRATVMVCVAMAGPLLGRRTTPSYSFLLALCLVLTRDPLAVSTAGFWLSFCAVGALLLGFAGYFHGDDTPRTIRQCLFEAGDKPRRLIRHSARWLWWNSVRPQWVVSLALLVPLLLWTGQYALLSPLANVFAIPWVSLLVVPLVLAGSALLLLDERLGLPVLTLADWSLDRLFRGLQALLNSSLAQAVSESGVWMPPPLTAPVVVFAALATLLLLLPRGLLPRWPALILMLPLLWPLPPARPEHSQAWLQVLDAGQGLAVLVLTGNHALLYDTGPGYSGEGDAGSAVVLPVLRHFGVTHLSAMVVSHWHDDHAGGAVSVLNAVPVNRLLAGGGSPQRLAGRAVETCHHGQRWQWDGVEFIMLHPLSGAPGQPDSAANLNNNSCVLMIVAGDDRALLTGDIERAAEQALVQRAGSQLQAQILLAPHHGSNTSSTAALLDAVRPDWLLISAGYRNRFNHPATAVLQRAAAREMTVLRTDLHGAIRLQLGDPSTPTLQRLQRQRGRRFWHDNGADDYGKVAVQSAGG